MKKVLIIEDHPDMRELISHQMKQIGFKVIRAERAKEGLEKAVAEKPHLILMDIMMPEMDGWEATRILRSNPETCDIPILAATVLFRESELRDCIEAGCNDCIIKPFTFQELQSKIQEILPATSTAIH